MSLQPIKSKSNPWVNALGIILLIVLAYVLNPKPQSTYKPQQIEQKTELDYTRHAKCRMSCREIDDIEVRDVLTNGEVNDKKSDPSAKPCPVEVREKRVISGQRVRVVFGKCIDKPKIITVIDLENEHACDCK